MTVEKCSVQQYSGKFNLLSRDEQACVAVRVVLDDGSVIGVSETWDMDDDPRDDDMWPEDALDLIEARCKSYWISTSRDETLAKIELIRSMMQQATARWAEAEIARRRTEIKRLEDQIESLSEMTEKEVSP